MGVLRILGFLVIVLVTIAGLDYYQQGKKHDGTLSASGYVETIKLRFTQQQEEREAKAVERDRKKRWKAGAKSHLPTAGAEWVQYELTDTDKKAVDIVLTNFGPTPLMSSISGTAELFRLTNSGKEGIVRKLSETGLVYVKGDEIAWFDISLKPKSARNTLAGMALSRQQNFMAHAATKKGFAVIDGVAFIETTQDLTSPTEALDFRKITGRIGIDEEVVIRMHTNAVDDTILELLGALDYATLNALLTYPSLVVGQGISVSQDRQADVAEKMDQLYTEMKLVQEKTTDEKLKNLDVAAMMVNSLTASDFNSDGLMDITGGEVFENQDILQIGYGRAQKLLLDSDQRQAAVAQDGKGAGFFSRLKDKLPAFKTPKASDAAVKPAPKKSAQPVRVHKGGLGTSCAQVGSLKRCSTAGQ
ncbi:hypothetical protein RUE5091_00161 [Ruegeria denitrificans]|uniref:Uncharacterized protein n=1 Tax=Ruegeria denitrificans TaxID=1715692 RepID=A0A0P1I104_9RHOB|nr:hypothetical protein [Ruegeria denitrificans]CUJ83913.1 hypothetical protein RUE5091_00161 [Ruegeria denitrificans]